MRSDDSRQSDYLFTWVPEGWEREKLVEFVRAFKDRGATEEPWTCAAHKMVHPGDRAYLLKQRKPIGIFGRGTIIGEPVQRENAEQGRGSWEVKLRFDARFGDVLCDPLECVFVNEEQLLRMPVSRAQWQRQSSGTRLDGKAARLIDQLISPVASLGQLTFQRETDDAIVDIVDLIKTSRTSGQGFTISPLVRRAVEVHAVKRAKAHYEGKGYSVKLVGKPYDLLCTRGDRETLYVEVKGTQGIGLEILLTPNEVIHARQQRDHMVLFVVSGIVVSDQESDDPLATGGDDAIYEPWNVDDGDLRPIGYCLKISRRAA